MSSSRIRCETQDSGHRPSLLPIALDRWRAWRITDLLPALMEEPHPDRPSLEVLHRADAVVDYYKERGGRIPPLGLVRRRTRECLHGGFCEGCEGHGKEPAAAR